VPAEIGETPSVRRVVVGACAGTAIVAALAAAAPTSRATFPGQNGKLAFGIGGIIVTENPDGTGRKTIVPLKPGVAVAAGEPAWSPDGTKIAYASRITGGGIQIVNADGTGTKRVTSAPTDGEPTWSPDGTKLAYVHVSTGRRRLVTSNLDGSGLVVVTSTFERDVDDPEWSPDGTRLAFSDTTDIYVVNVDGSNLVDLTADPGEPGRADHPSWSPDGSKIAYQYLNTIKTIAPDGSGSTTLVPNLGGLWELSWSPDGTKIAFSNDVGGPLQEELFFVNSDGTNLVRPGIDLETTLDWGVAAAAPAVPPPVTGVNVNAKPVAGTVLVRVKGTTTFVALTALTSIPVGSELDLTNGRVQLTSTGAGGTNQTAVFYQGRAVIGQTRATPPVTTLTLSGQLVCPKRKVSANGPKTRSLWGNGKGNFETFGRYAAATVRGTYWLTQDTCAGTLVRVRSGTVTVLDRVRHRTVTVGAGKSYFARAKR
jgi:Tol biopolymer transport system component